MPTETTPALTLVEMLQNVRCDRQPFTDEHKFCICRLTNKAAVEIERLSKTLRTVRNEALEEAAKVADDLLIGEPGPLHSYAAAAIRSLKSEVSRERETG